jgi:hypothetical protein
MTEARIIIIADDRSQAELDALIGRLDNVDRSGKKTTSTFRDFADSMAGGAHEVERAMSMMTRLDLVQISIEQSNDHVAAAQERYNDALARYGPNSQQAVTAAQGLKGAHDSLEKSQLRAELSMGLVIASSLQMATTAVPAAIAALTGLAAAETTAAVAGGILATTLSLGTAAIAITAGIVALKAAMDGFSGSTSHASDDVTRYEADLQRANEKVDRLAKGQLTFKETFSWKTDAQLAAGALRSVEDAARSLADAEAEAARTYIQNEDLKATLAGNDAEAIKRIRDAAAQDLASQDAALRSNVGSAARGAAEAAKQSDVDRIKSADDALKRIGDDAKATEDKLTAAAKATDDAWKAALGHVGVSLEALSTAALGQLSTAAGELGGLAKQALDARAAEDEITKSALQSSDALRKQAHITAEKEETTADFIKRLKEMGFTEAEIAQRLDATGRVMRSQSDATDDATTSTRNLQSAQAAYAGSSYGSSSSGAYGGGGGVPAWAAGDLTQRRISAEAQTRIDQLHDVLSQTTDAQLRSRFLGELASLQQGSAFVDARGNTRWDLASLMNTGPGVDVTGVKRGTYAPHGVGFQNVGGIGSTDMPNVYGSRTLVSDNRGGMNYDGDNPQGGQVFNGGIVVNVYNPRNQKDVEDGVRQGTTGAGTQTRTRASARRG